MRPMTLQEYFKRKGNYGGAGMTLEEAKNLLDEEYERAKRLEYVINPLAYALHQVWKIADKKRRENGKS